MKNPIISLLTAIQVVFLLLSSHAAYNSLETSETTNKATQSPIAYKMVSATATPVLISLQTTNTSPKALRANPTRTPRPTQIPPEIPPPTDRRLMHSMILFGVVAVIVVIFGVWINRDRINMR
jgi:hypothetical protein